ncbi:hypothetical protein [Paenisporosarcina cavernae]|uniref:Uncharacterized protein n=1 Tax=Paenisporosarcina cavernae TaxID=2320858 RepID=A0A385YX19_9BACL|nr:hypothetical protein [Paenisporosarcina cavernae]AYC30093.1 hypothetical protein D3873_09485 [Paenisporosarcina cavernae]
MNVMVAFGYIFPTLIAFIFVGYFAPLIGLVVGFFFHLFIMIYEIHSVVVPKDKRDKVLIAVERYKQERELKISQSENNEKFS